MAKIGLPAIVSNIPSDLRQFLDRVREYVHGGADFVTKNDLVRGTLATTDPLGNLIPISGAVIDFTPPPAPTGLAANGALTTVLLTWTDPLYINLAYTEIWRSGTNDVGTAVLAGVANGALYSDTVGAQSSHYYWVRFVSKADVEGPFNATAGDWVPPAQTLRPCSPFFPAASLRASLTQRWARALN